MKNEKFDWGKISFQRKQNLITVPPKLPYLRKFLKLVLTAKKNEKFDWQEKMLCNANKI